jgi:hypothetical protein
MMKKVKILNMAINNISRELSGILDCYGYETTILPARRVSSDIKYYRAMLRDLEFHIKEYEALSGKKHNLKEKTIEFYEGMWYLKKEGHL